MGCLDWLVGVAASVGEACGDFWEAHGDDVKKGLVRGGTAAVAGALVGAIIAGPPGAVAGGKVGAAIGAGHG